MREITRKEIEDTMNIHKIINCIFPTFKSKWLCNKNIHDYRLHRIKETNELIWKCYCCGKEN